MGFTQHPHHTRRSPLALLRDGLNRAGVTPSNRLEHGQQTAVAGIVISRQRPSTANGTVFILLEDEFGHCQAIASKDIWLDLERDLRRKALIVSGVVRRFRGFKTITVEQVMPLEGVDLGAAGAPKA